MKLLNHDYHWYRPHKGDWASWTNAWIIGIWYYNLGIGVVRTDWGYRILLGPWQLCCHKKEVRK